MTRGSLVVSLDAELAWGFHHVEPPGGRLREARRTWRRLVGLFDRYGVPATWAVVGHLFLENCTGSHDGHPAGARPCERDAGDLPAAKAWFADGLLDAVGAAAVDHEVAGHGFTHVHFGHDRMTRAYVREELSRTRSAATAAGHDLSSFVFPVNVVDHRELLADAGFECYRGRPPDDRRLRRLRKVAGALLDRGTPPVVRPRVDEHGLVNVPASMYLFDELGRLGPLVAPLRGDPVVRRAIRGIDAAAADGGVCHLWFHPHDATTARDYDRLRAVLAHAARRREEGRLRVETMGDVARRTRAGAARDGATGTITGTATAGGPS